MQRPFEGIRVIDATHVLAGPFAAYQLAVLGADVIKVEHPHDPDQSRLTGSDRELGKRHMGTSYLTQASNKRSLTLDLKQTAGQEICKKLVGTADVLVENYRPGALDALGLGYEAMAAINPRLIYASMSAFGQRGPRAQHTAYDYVIQATSGIMAMTGTPDVNPIKFGSPAIDCAHRHDRRVCACERLVSTRAHRPRPAHRPRHVGCGDDPDGIAPHRLHTHRAPSQA